LKRRSRACPGKPESYRSWQQQVLQPISEKGIDVVADISLFHGLFLFFD
jgi:hypothetical protein